MAEFYFSVNLDQSKTLCVAPLTDRRLELSGQELPDTSGYFLFEQHGEDEKARVEIIAQVLSEEAALRLKDMFKMA
jgi:hypothetical protein